MANGDPAMQFLLKDGRPQRGHGDWILEDMHDIPANSSSNVVFSLGESSQLVFPEAGTICSVEHQSARKVVGVVTSLSLGQDGAVGDGSGASG